MALTNVNLTAAMRQNLVNLQQTATKMEITQNRLASGLRVATALDDPINFFTAQEHRQRAADLASRKDSMSEAIQTVKAANQGIEGLTSLLAQAKSLAQSAQSSTSTSAALFASQYNEVRSQITALAEDSGYKGINLLNGTSQTLEVGFNADGSNSITLTGFAGTAAGLKIDDVGCTSAALGTLWCASATEICSAAIAGALTAVDYANNELRSQAKILSSKLNIISTRDAFATNMINTLEEGADKLTLADMNEESANMLMLQTRQSLGTTSLSLASQAAQSILRLF
jgi:flagellin-like hook-associated protein FlgL